MYGIAAAKGVAGRKDMVWLDPNLAAKAFPFGHTAFHLGGIFTSVPVAVSSQARRPIVVKENTAAARVQTVGGGASALLTNRLDVFGLGLDYAMYHKTLWGDYGDDTGPWENLGGIFTSSPAALAWGAGRVDVFGLGTDHAMFHKFWNGNTWTPNWERLGGTFSSAASVVSWGVNRLDIFARGTDFSLRHRSYDGTHWTSDWQSLGGSLASPPCAVSWGPNRLDVFALGTAGDLIHRWWDGEIWNDWESLGGVFSSAPAAVCWGPDRIDVFAVGTLDKTKPGNAVYHLAWDGDAWSQWENLGGHITSSPTAISTAPNRLDVLAPGIDGNIYWRPWDGSAWQGAFGAPFSPLEKGIALPSRYRFSVDFVTADTTRSLNADTDTATATLAVGNWPALTATQSMGDIGGTHPSQAQTNLLHFTPITVELCEAAAFNYLIVNNGHADQKSLDDALVKAGTSLTDDAVKSVSQDLGAGAGAITGIEVGGVVAPVIGSLLGALVGWLLGELGGVVFADCDGIVAAEQVVLLGRDLQQHLGKYTHVVTVHPGTDSNHGCGPNSKYEVTWSITRA